MKLLVSFFLVIFASGCISNGEKLITEAQPESLSGTWAMKLSSRVNRTIKFEKNGSCNIHQKESHESLLFRCRYEKRGANVFVYHVHPLDGHDLKEIESLEYSAIDEKLISYRDPDNQENNWEYIKIEN